MRDQENRKKFGGDKNSSSDRGFGKSKPYAKGTKPKSSDGFENYSKKREGDGPKSAASGRPRITKSQPNDRHTFRKREDRPWTKDKPTFERSSDRRDDRPRKDGDSSKDRPWTKDKPAYGKSNDRPKREGDRPWTKDKPAYGRSNDRPKRDGDSSKDRPWTKDKPSYGNSNKKELRPKREFDAKKTWDKDKFKSNFDKKEDNSFKSPFGQKFSKHDDNSAPNTGGFKKFGAKKEVDQATIQSSKERQVGFSKPAFAEEEVLKKKLPKRLQQEIEARENEKNDDIRLNRYISNAGLCSRREADELIASGTIKVNGVVITEMGYKVAPGDTVKYGKDVLNREKMMYVILNKPKDFITTMDDPSERRTVMELVAGACTERIYPVGRLDRNTTGLLLLTNDGELTAKLTHPASNIMKIYQAEIDKPITEEDFEKLKEGVELEDGFIKPDEVAMITPDSQVVGIKIHSGKNRVVRRIFEHLGYEVTKLDRTTFAGLTKKDLPRGKWRFLSEKEIIRLKYMI